MKTSAAIIAALSISTGMGLVTGCEHERMYQRTPAMTASGQEELVVTEAPPPPIAESIGISPGAGYVWIPGAWDWRGSAWVWQKGRWEAPPAPGEFWVPNRYEERDGKRVFIRGGWSR